ncbi:MAG: glycoside hydrolase family 2 sugar binding protein, partial [Bacilli bacterium]|nr:glycoside hydrolase family 2 sugar binding protein [Bacilli bacterium]
MQINLNGTWEYGSNRVYEGSVSVPGLAADPSKMNVGPLCYKRSVNLPAGHWTHATLILKGARFSPAIFIDGELVGKKQGGMTTTTYLLSGQIVQPGKTITLEIALQSLADLDPQDASRIPRADHWRS